MKSIFFIASFFACFTNISFAHPLHKNGIEHPTYALIISISSYPEQPGWPTVDSRKDVDNIKYFITKFAPNSDINNLRDEKATKKNIIDDLNSILKNCEDGDRIYLHFSGGGFQLNADTVRQVFMPYDAPSIADISDAVMNNKTPDLSHVILDHELIDLIQKIRHKIGSSGQFLFTMDASHFGPKDTKPQSLVGREGFFKITDIEAGLSPFIMLSSCLDKQESYFIGDKEPYDRSFSLALKKYTTDIKPGQAIKYPDLFAGVKKELATIASLQTPAIAGSTESYVFSGGTINKSPAFFAPDNISKNARLFILSIGISNYNGPYAFANCDDDAILFTQTIRSAWSYDTAQIKTWLILNNTATKEAILKAINEIIAQAKDDDIFAFFFAGFTNEPKNNDGTYQETWFYPQTNKAINIEDRKGINEKEILTLSELKKMFDYLKCDKQLLFTEAGLTENFKREFVRSMIKTNPVITEIRKRNRIIIVPDKAGWDEVICNGKRIMHGPGLYFFTELFEDGTNIFDLFSNDESKRKNVVYQYRKIQFKCQYKEQYVSFFFEKEFVEDLQYYFTKDIPANSNRTRGAEGDEQDQKIASPNIGNKYALVIGTDKFTSWNKLQNPVNDASSVADTLSGLFGFKITLLKNPTLKEIYNALYSYRNILQEIDQFLLYLAGHGYYDSPIFKDGFIVTSDSKALRADTFLSSYIPFNQLRNVTDNFKAKQIMVLLDVCFSGAFDDNDESLGGISIIIYLEN